MNLPLFHDPLQGTVTVDAPLRDPRPGRDAASTREPQAPARSTKSRHVEHASTRARSGAPTRSARQLKVAEDLQALMARTADRH
ncbi:hypothetical protein AAHB33_04280 [Paenarthrobacter sp. S56]|uniref:hypothetical protein n=1 Tax=Paenarthrobacter sp. S56 TaxID=3138179 RepID=UPI0032198CC4